MKKPVILYGTVITVAALLSFQCEAIKRAQIAKQSATADGEVRQMSDIGFNQEVLKSNVPVFVDFWAPWCGPCMAMGPVVEKLAKEYKGRVRFFKMNVDENKVATEVCHAGTIPNFVIFKNGREVGRRVGGCRIDELRAVVDKAIGE